MSHFAPANPVSITQGQDVPLVDDQGRLTVTMVIKRYEDKRARLTIWFTHWQRIAEWLFTRKASFTNTFREAEFLDRQIFDTTAPLALDISSSALLDILWPSGGQSFEVVPCDELKGDSDAEDYFAWASQQVSNHMDDPNAGLASALSEYMKEELAFGNSGVGVFEDNVTGLPIYIHASIREIVFGEGPYGHVDDVWFARQRTIQQVVQEYGIDKVSPTLRQKYTQKMYDEYVLILRAIVRRPASSMFKTSSAPGSKLNMAWASFHVEYDTRHLLKEDGYEEQAIIVGRYDRYANEEPGRGPGSKALPDIIKCNAIAEALMLASEKKLDPALWMVADTGTQTLDKSAGGVTIFNPNNLIGGQAPIGTINTVGTLTEAQQLLGMYQNSIKSHFYIDRLLDMTGETKEMTAEEARLRDILRNKTLREPVNRQVTEFFTPMIIRTYNIMWRNGKLGAMPGTLEHQYAMASGEQVVPDSVARLVQQGKKPWDIRYKTPAARAAYAQQAQNNSLYVQQVAIASKALGDPALTALVDSEEMMRDQASYLGVTAIRSKKVMKNMRAQQAQQLAAQQSADTASQLLAASNGNPDAARLLATSAGAVQGSPGAQGI